MILNALLATAVINAVANTAVAFFEARGQDHIKAFSISALHPSVITDGLGLLFTLPLITCLLCTAGVRREQLAERIEPMLAVPAPWVTTLARLRVLTRAVRLGVVTFLVLGPPLVLALALAAPHGLDHHQFVLYHVGLAVALGAVVTPVIAIAAMADVR